jgi:caffeoyl-CoA O-methyltransferase
VRPGTLILVDNVLWKGRVLGIEASLAGPVEGEDKATRRDRVLTQAMHEFNVKVRRDVRVEKVILPLRDGLSLIRIK